MTNLSKKISTLMLITALLLCNVTMVFADTDSLDNYRQLEYIEANGGQYINTGISPNQYANQLIIVADMAFTEVPSSSSAQAYLFGSGYYSSNSSNRSNIVAGYRGGTSTSQFSFLNGGQLSDAVTDSAWKTDTNRHDWTINQYSRIYILDRSGKSFNTSISNNLSNSILIFGAYQSGSSGAPIGYFSKARCYEFEITWQKDNDTFTELRHFIPVERLSDNEIGLYDTVNNQFYSNAGTGSFIAGYQTQYQITTNASPSGAGSIQGGGSYTYGQTCTLMATPNTGYIFTSWSDGTTNNPKSFTVTSSVTITANFELITQNYTVTTTVSPVGSGTVTGSGTYERGDTVELVATPATGYVFRQWSDGVFYATRYFTIQNDVNLTAYFEEEQSEYEVTLSVYPENSGTVEGDGTYEAGQTIQISAEAEEGYEFVSWSDGSIANPRSITVNQTIDLTANFRAIEPEPEFDQDNIILIILLLSFMVIYFIGRGEIYNG